MLYLNFPNEQNKTLEVSLFHFCSLLLTHVQDCKAKKMLTMMHAMLSPRIKVSGNFKSSQTQFYRKGEGLSAIFVQIQNSYVICMRYSSFTYLLHSTMGNMRDIPVEMSPFFKWPLVHQSHT